MQSSSSPTRPPSPVVRLLPQLADRAAREFGDAPFVLRRTSDAWEGYSFAQAARAMRVFAALLAEQGVGPGDRVALQSENRPEWGLAYLAILEAGAVVVPLDTRYTVQETGEILAAAAASHAVGSRRQLDVLDQARRARRPELRLITLDPAVGLPSWQDAETRFAGAPPRETRAQPTDPAVLLFTSGTSGKAKGVMLSHSSLLHNVEAVARILQFGPGDRLLSVLPLHHTFESTGGFLCPLRMGASVAYARSLQSGELMQDLRSSGATIMLGVPLLYEKFLAGIRRGISEAPPPRRWAARALIAASRIVRLATGARVGSTLLAGLRERAGLGRLRMFVSGAAALAPETFWGLTDLGLPMLQGYGLTECSPVIAAQSLARPRPGSVGRPLPGVEVRIERPGADGQGEIVVRGPNLMLGYLDNPAGTAEVIRDGWLFTGDLGRISAAGELSITGRLKNMIATAAGKKIYPEEVETRLAGSPYILEVVVAGGRDARGEREEVHAHVVPNLPALEALARHGGRACDRAFIEESLRREVETRCQELAPYKRVRRVIVRDREFPKTSTGKIIRPGPSAEIGGDRVGRVA